VVACSDGFFADAVCNLGCTVAFFSGEYEGDDARVDGVRGDDDPCEDDSGLEGSSSGTGTGAGTLRRVEEWREWGWEKRDRYECDVRATADRPSWWARRSSSAMLSSKSSTSRNSRSMRPTSRLPKTPVHSAQCTFFSVESLRY
jgi:hypothetical protein